MTHLLTSLLALQAGSFTDGRTQLNLVIQSTEQLPAGFTVAGAEFSTSGRLLLWSATTPLLLLTEGYGFQTLEFGSNQAPIAAGFLNDSSISVLTGQDGRVLTLHVSGRGPASESFLTSLRNDNTIISAAFRNGEWCVATRDTLGSIVVVQEGTNEKPLNLLRLNPLRLKQYLPDSLPR